jgi:hypothetical protein
MEKTEMHDPNKTWFVKNGKKERQSAKPTQSKKYREKQKQESVQKSEAPSKQQSLKKEAPVSKGLREVSGNQGRVVVKGQNYTVWKGEHRVRVGNRWRRFGPLTALSAVVVGGASYYAYAYLSAPEPVCDGLTDDGYVLRWVEVETLDGDRVYQCVAFAPR